MKYLFAILITITLVGCGCCAEPDGYDYFEEIKNYTPQTVCGAASNITAVSIGGNLFKKGDVDYYFEVEWDNGEKTAETYFNPLYEGQRVCSEYRDYEHEALEDRFLMVKPE